MSKVNTPQSRKTFISVGISVAAILSGLRFFILKKEKKANTVKMLTQDGKLVEIDVEKLSGKRKKISNDELKNWLNKKNKILV